MDYGTLPDVKDMTDAELLAELPTRGKLAAVSITPGQDFPQQPSMIGARLLRER
jgi:hypothetical protein